MISIRYIVPVLLLFALALVPTTIHSYLQARVDDGKSVKNISTVLAGMKSVPYTRHTDKWVSDMFDSQDWIERIYKDGDGTKLRLFVARSFDHKRLYHHPELGLSHGSNFIKSEYIKLQGVQNGLVNILTRKDGKNNNFVVYALLYSGDFISNPIKHQIKESLALLVNPRKPMTIFYIDSKEQLDAGKFSESKSSKLLSAAVKSFQDIPNDSANR